MCARLHIKAVIIDDSPQARKLLRLMLQELETDIDVIAEAENAEKGLQIIENHQPDILFLDIEMPGGSGLSLAEEIKNRNIQSSIIFTTAYKEHAIKAFRLAAVDYLLKPIQEDQLTEAIDRVRQNLKRGTPVDDYQALFNNLQESKRPVLCLPMQNNTEYITLEDIIYLEAEGSYVRVYCTDQKSRIVSKNLKYFDSCLQDFPQFIRTHRSYLVNKSYISGLLRAEGCTVVLKNGQKIPVSRERKSQVKSMLG